MSQPTAAAREYGPQCSGHSSFVMREIVYLHRFVSTRRGRFSPAPGGGANVMELAPDTAHAASMPLRIRQQQALHFTRVRSRTCATT